MIVYSMLNQHNGKRYIGYTSKSLKKRRNKHLRLLRQNGHPNRHIQHAWNQGDRYFLWTILEVCSSIDEMKLAEIKWIGQYCTTDDQYGYNMTYGGEGGVPTEETRLKISLAKKGIPLSEETKKKMGDAHRGRKRTPRSLEWRSKMSSARMGHPLSPEVREKMSTAQKARRERERLSNLVESH